MDINTSVEQLATHLLSPEERPTMDNHEVQEGPEGPTTIDGLRVQDDHHRALHHQHHPITTDDELLQQGVLVTDSNSTSEDAWYRNPSQITAMISNFSTSYNVVNISLVLPILQQLTDSSSSQDASACASSLLAGMILGQLVGGALGDSVLGRMGALNLVMGIQLVASIASACLSMGGNGTSIYVKLALCRFILGVGAGGVYPLAAVVSAEQSKTNQHDSHQPDRVQRVVLTFGMQGLGFLAVPLVAVLLLYTTSNLNVIWRILLGLGSVPGVVVMILRWRLYTQLHQRGAAVRLDEPTEDVEAVNGNIEADGIVIHETSETPVQSVDWWEAIRHEPGLGGKILGTAGTWFLFDVLFYGNTLFQPVVVEAAFGAAGQSDNAIQMLQKTAVDSLILASIALPGYAVAGLLLGKRTLCVTQTPRYVMLQGFAAMSVLYFTIGSNWSFLRKYPAALVTLYGMTFFFANYGPNTTTFILPSLVYSPECRSTWNGISAASGKLGALLGATLFAPTADAWGDGAVMVICSAIAVVALVITWFFVPQEDDSDTHQQHQPLQQEQNTSEEDAPFGVSA